MFLGNAVQMSKYEVKVVIKLKFFVTNIIQIMQSVVIITLVFVFLRLITPS